MAASATICISRVTDRLSIQPAIRQGDEADVRVRVAQLQRTQPGRSAEKLHGKNGIPYRRAHQCPAGGNINVSGE